MYYCGKFKFLFNKRNNNTDKKGLRNYQIIKLTAMKTNGLRTILIYGLTRNKLIDFVKRKDHSYSGTDFSGFSHKQLFDLALHIDKKVQANRKKIKTSEH